ncbi:thioredoxin-disulfide reductase [Candidatus Berkelbacteria bacterium]|nr:thioredoxin-disulfide reductase [Candidatus Berkelbacteria bacterium]
MSKVHNLIIIGSGPAGLTAGLYAARAELEPLIIGGLEAGGQLMLTTEVENFPGYESILGPELIDKITNHAKKFGTELIRENVTKVDFSSQPLKVWAGDQEYHSKSVIIATGASARWLGLDSETRLRGKGVSSCATCDGFFFKDKDIAVVGGGDSALEEATFLTKFASKVSVIVRRDELRASKPLQKRAQENPKIEFVWNSEVQEVLGDSKVEGVRLKNNKTEAESDLKLDGLFVAIGHTPNTGIFEGQIDLDEKGYIKPVKNTAASVSGIFVAGDVEDIRYRQAITAAGSGCKAALDAEKWLAEQGNA